MKKDVQDKVKKQQVIQGGRLEKRLVINITGNNI